jgi:hypothetical protein
VEGAVIRVDEDAAEIIRWLNSDESCAWRKANIVPVEYSVSVHDGQAPERRLRLAFASLKFDYRGGPSGAHFSDPSVVREEISRMRYLRRNHDDYEEYQVRCQEILWDGFRWTPDEDPVRA